jgi:lipopolysaccharide export system protein LptA
MKTTVRRSVVVLAVMFFGLVFANLVLAETMQKKLKKTDSNSMVINSNTLEVDDQKRIVTFKGDVNAKRDDFVIDCQQMLVYYRTMPGQKGQEESETKIEKIVATGNVRIQRSEGGLATSEKAVYFQNEEKVVLTENPVVKKGKDFVEGDRITIFLKENRSVVESSGNRRVKAIIFPKKR